MVAGGHVAPSCGDFVARVYLSARINGVVDAAARKATVHLRMSPTGRLYVRGGDGRWVRRRYLAVGV